MPDALAAFTWAAVFDRIERVWRTVIAEPRLNRKDARDARIQ